MKEDIYTEVQKIDKEQLIDVLTEELCALRAKIGLSQEELSSIIDISRQTYNSIETKKRRMTWSTYLSLILVFDSNEKTRGMLNALGVFPKELVDSLNAGNR